MKGGTVLLAKTPLSTDLYLSVAGGFSFLLKISSVCKEQNQKRLGLHIPAAFRSCACFSFIGNFICAFAIHFPASSGAKCGVVKEKLELDDEILRAILSASVTLTLGYPQSINILRSIEIILKKAEKAEDDG